MTWLAYLQTHYIKEHIKNKKVITSLVSHTYQQNYIGMFASIFCATIIFIGLFALGEDNTQLYIWSIFFLSVSIARIGLTMVYQLEKFPENHIILWRNLYILGALLGGITWGYLGMFIFPYATTLQQTLIVLMVAGVTAGAVPLSASIPSATIAFLFFCLSPYIISIVLFNNTTYLLFDLALFLYLLYTIVLSLRAYDLIYNSIILKFENDHLLNDLAISNRKLIRAATHDPLTQVANRRLFKNNLEQSILKAKESHSNLALLYMDLDQFKVINDVYGHQAGDYVLLTVIKRLEIFFRRADHISRLGGDELAIIIENVKHTREIEKIADRICQLICLPIKINDIELVISASIGISIYPDDGSNEESLLQCADKRMYQAKKLGGNRYYLNSDLQSTS